MIDVAEIIKGNENYTLESANQLYVANNYPLTERFQTLMKNDFGAAAENVDFTLDETRLNINKWVEDFTHQKIKDLIPNGKSKQLIIKTIRFWVLYGLSVSSELIKINWIINESYLIIIELQVLLML